MDFLRRLSGKCVLKKSHSLDFTFFYDITKTKVLLTEASIFDITSRSFTIRRIWADSLLAEEANESAWAYQGLYYIEWPNR